MLFCSLLLVTFFPFAPFGCHSASSCFLFFVAGAKAYNGGKSLKMIYFKDLHNSHKPGNYRVLLSKSYNKLYYSIKIRTEDNFDGVRGGKLPGLCGGKCNTGGNVPTGYDGWSARNMWQLSHAELIHYCYTGNQITKHPTPQRWNLGGAHYLRDGQWHTLEHRIVMNTPNVANGIVQGWFDGQLVLDARNMLWRRNASIQIDSFYFSTFFGGATSTWAPQKDEVIYFDELIISESPITHGAVVVRTTTQQPPTTTRPPATATPQPPTTTRPPATTTPPPATTTAAAYGALPVVYNGSGLDSDWRLRGPLRAVPHCSSARRAASPLPPFKHFASQ